MTALGMLALLLVSGLVSGTETAVFSLRAAERRALSDGRAGLARLLSRPAHLLVTLLLTNLLVNVAYFTLSASWSLRLVQAGEQALSVAVALGSLGALVVLGEIVPKTLALVTAPTLVRRMGPPLELLAVVFGPLVAVGAWLTELLEGLLVSSTSGRQVDRRDFKSMLGRGGALGSYRTVELALLHDVVDFGERKARNLMVPRVDMVVLDLEDDRARWLEIMAEHPYRDYPVVRGSADDLRGTVNAARFLDESGTSRAELVEPALLAPLGISAERLVVRMQEERQRLAVLVDEFGGVAGLVGVAQLTKAVLGEIEPLRTGPVRRLRTGGAMVVDGRCPLHVLEEELGLQLERRRADTVGGAVAEALARVPQRGDELQMGGWRVRVLALRGQRVSRVLVRPETQ